jgi:hypothetical protein
LDNTELHNDNLQDKFLAIEDTLNELNMSKEELIELIRKILEAEIKIDPANLNLDLSQNANEISQKIIEDFIENPASVSQYIATKNIEKIQEILAFAVNVQNLKELKIELEYDKLKKDLEIQQDILKLKLQGVAQTNKGDVNLNTSQLKNFNKSSSEAVEKESRKKDNQKISGITASISSTLNKLVSDLRGAIGNLNPNANRVNSNLAQKPNSGGGTNQQKSAPNLSRMNELAKQVKVVETKIKNNNPSVTKVRFNGRNLVANVRQKGEGRSERRRTVKLDDLVKKDEKSSNAENNKDVDNIKNLQKDLVVETQKQQQVSKNLDSLDLDLKIQEKSKQVDTLKSKLAEVEVKSSSNNSSGGGSANAEKNVAVDQSVNNNSNQQPIILGKSDLSQSLDAGVVSKKESMKTAVDLAKLDAIHDSQKLLSQTKNSGEMKEILDSTKKIAIDLKEAEQNKDLLEDIKKQRMQDRFLKK